jgi:regulator of sigma E protease
MSIVYTIIILCVLILTHEFGHFAVAKLNGIFVEEFSLGMGPKIVQWKGKETKYSLRIFPIGGYVKMNGEDEASEEPNAFCQKSVLARMAVVFSGPAMNFIFAIIFFMVAYMYFGVPSQSTVIGEVMADKPAAAAGIETGDRISQIDGVVVSEWLEAVEMIRQNAGKELNLVMERDGSTYNTEVTPVLDEQVGYGILGITQSVDKVNIIESVKLGCVQTYNFSKLLLVSLYQMATGQMKVEVAGPVGMVGMVGDYAEVGFMYLFLFAGILSINLGIINLLPFPALDGSRLLFLAIEGIRGKPIDPNKEGFMNFVGLMVLLGLMVLITYNDIIKLIGG